MLSLLLSLLWRLPRQPPANPIEKPRVFAERSVLDRFVSQIGKSRSPLQVARFREELLGR